MRYLKTYNESLEDKRITCGIYLFDKIRSGIKKITMNFGNDFEIGK